MPRGTGQSPQGLYVCDTREAPWGQRHPRQPPVPPPVPGMGGPRVTGNKQSVGFLPASNAVTIDIRPQSTPLLVLLRGEVQG